MTVRRATTPHFGSNVQRSQGRGWVPEVPVAQAASASGGARINPQYTGYAGGKPNQAGTKNKQSSMPSKAPTQITGLRGTTRNSPGACAGRKVTPAPAPAANHDAAGAATGAATAEAMYWRQAYLNTHASPMHASNAAPDDFMLNEVGPAGASCPDLLGSNAEEAPQETPVNRLCTENAPETMEVAQPSSYILPSAEKGLEPGYRAQRLNTLTYNGNERKVYVGNVGKMLTNLGKEYFATDKYYVSPLPPGLQTTGCAFRKPRLLITNTIQYGRAGPKFQASCRPEDPSKYPRGSYIHTATEETLKGAWEKLQEETGATLVAIPSDRELFGRPDSELQKIWYLQCTAEQQRYIDQVEHEKRMTLTPKQLERDPKRMILRAEYRATPLEVLQAYKGLPEALLKAGNDESDQHEGLVGSESEEESDGQLYGEGSMDELEDSDKDSEHQPSSEVARGSKKPRKASIKARRLSGSPSRGPGVKQGPEAPVFVAGTQGAGSFFGGGLLVPEGHNTPATGSAVNPPPLADQGLAKGRRGPKRKRLEADTILAQFLEGQTKLMKVLKGQTKLMEALVQLK